MKFTRLSAVAFFLALFAVNSNAQELIWNQLDITAPSSVAGSYSAFTASFGPQDTMTITGSIVLVDDGENNDGAGSTTDACTEIMNEISGNIALVDRGSCAFVDKVNNAQLKGALAVIVCNNDPEDDIFRMGGEDENITTPSMMISYQDCQTIRAEVNNGLVGSFKFFVAPCAADCANATYPENTVWGQNGEGSFACGLGDWTTSGYTLVEGTEDVAVWEWDHDGLPVGQFGAPRAIESESVCNGAAMFDFCNWQVISGNPNTGFDYRADLTSPIIDLTGYSSPVLHYTQYLNTLSEGQVLAYVTYSRDGGETWGDTTSIESDHFINSNGESPEFFTRKVEIPFCGDEIGDTDQFRIKFIADGNFYFWTVDDVYITNQDIADVDLDGYWLGTAVNYKTPSSQVDEIPFVADIYNRGNADFSDVSYSVTVSKDGNELYSAESGSLGALDKCSDIQNTVLADFYQMSDEPGTYDINYTLNLPEGVEDAVPSNNARSTQFVVSDNWFGKMPTEEEAGEEFLVGLGQNASYVTIANSYYIKNGENWLPNQVACGFDNDLFADFQNVTLTAEIREWAGDLNGNGSIELNTETVVVANGFKLISSSDENLRNIVIDVSSTVSSLNDNTNYLVVIHMKPLSPPTEDVFVAPLSSGFINTSTDNHSYNPFASVFAFGQNDQLRGASYSDFVSFEEDVDEENRILTPESGTDEAISWYVQMRISNTVNTVDINNDLAVEVYPNPATDVLSVDVSLENVSKTVKAELVSLNGQVVASANFSNVKTDVLKVNTAEVSSGVYMLNVITDAGMTSTRVMINK